MDVIISSGGMSHGYHWARGIQKAGYLKRIITTLNLADRPEIDSTKVKRVILPELIGHVLWRLPGANSLYLAYWIRDNLYDWLARRHVDAADIFHGLNHFSLYTMRKARRLGMKTLIERGSAHPETVHTLLSEEYARYGLRFPQANKMLIAKHVQEYHEADTVIVPSDFVRRTMIEKGIPEEKLRIVPPGFAPEQFHPGSGDRRDDIFRILFVGAIGLQKGVQYLLEAFKQLALPNSELVLVGGIFPDSHAFLPQYEGLYRHVNFMPQDQLIDLYNSASVFVLPSIQDGFGMVVYEAAACGLPVIVSENVGATIRDGQDGYIVPVRNMDALRERLSQLYHDPSLRQAMGRSAMAYARQFTWENSYQKLFDVYQELFDEVKP